MNKRQALIYSLCLVSFIAAVIVKQRLVLKERGRQIISITSEWKKKGKPVVVTQLARRNLNIYTKITVTRAGENSCQAYVPAAIKRKLQRGQLVFFSDETKDPMGEIIEVSDEIDLDSGMFYVKISLNDETQPIEKNNIVYVNTGILEDVICVPNEVLLFDEAGYFVWVVEDGKAARRRVSLKEHNGYGAIIETGLKEGDLLILQGFTRLAQGDKVNILEDRSFPGEKL